MSPADVRGGICGLCGEPLFFGHCQNHGKRATDAPTQSIPGWVDGRSVEARNNKEQQ